MYCSELITIPLAKHRAAIIDPEDLGKVLKYNWYLVQSLNTCYAASMVDGKTVYLHRLVIDAPHGLMVDHINRGGLDCRKSNLRFCTGSQNQGNAGKRRDGLSSRYKGVCFEKKSGKFYAYIYQNSKQIGIGRFESEEDAARAYNRKAVEYFGEFANLNPVEVVNG